MVTPESFSTRTVHAALTTGRDERSMNVPTRSWSKRVNEEMVDTDARGNPILSPEKMRVYLTRRETDLTGLRAALDRDAYSEIREVAHRIKGSAAMYGCDSLGEICARLEAAVVAEDRPEAERGIDAFETALRGFQAQFA